MGETQSHTNNEYIMTMEGITKTFLKTKALDGVDFYLKPGQINCLLGENGAGKSTLIKIMSGVYDADGGTMQMEGKPISFASPSHARKMGVIPIYQELDLIDCMTVAENIFMNNEPMKNALTIDYKAMNRRAGELLSELGIEMDVETKVEEFSVAYKQMIAIAKALSMESKVLILDEPSDVLTGNELETLFRIIQTIKAKNVGIVYISHRLDEVFEIGDVVTILRDGKLITTAPVEGLTRAELIRAMVGREINEDIQPKCEDTDKPIAVEVEGYTNNMLSDVSFTLRQGEVLGVFGLVGAGRTELARAIVGVDTLKSGTLKIYGKQVAIRGPVDAVNMGIGYVPEDRKDEGLVLVQSVKYNAVLPIINKLCNFGFLKVKDISNTVNKFVDMLRIKIADSDQQVSNLSGGNQQKVVIAKWLASGAKILILDEPTRGIDVSAKSEIYRIIEEFAQAGHAIMLISSEMSEILNLSNRIMVMSEGVVTTQFNNNQVSQEELLEHAMPRSLLANG